MLVVDDGSHDDTAARAAAAGAEVLRQPVNGGKGAALRAGMAWLAARGVSTCSPWTATASTSPSEIPLLLAASAAAPDALVIGARQIGDQEVHAA